jgi:hypothetical protein
MRFRPAACAFYATLAGFHPPRAAPSNTRMSSRAKRPNSRTRSVSGPVAGDVA